MGPLVKQLPGASAARHLDEAVEEEAPLRARRRTSPAVLCCAPHAALLTKPQRCATWPLLEGACEGEGADQKAEAAAPKGAAGYLTRSGAVLSLVNITLGGCICTVLTSAAAGAPTQCFATCFDADAVFQQKR